MYEITTGNMTFQMNNAVDAVLYGVAAKKKKKKKVQWFKVRSKTD